MLTGFIIFPFDSIQHYFFFWWRFRHFIMNYGKYLILFFGECWWKLVKENKATLIERMGLTHEIFNNRIFSCLFLDMCLDVADASKTPWNQQINELNVFSGGIQQLKDGYWFNQIVHQILCFFSLEMRSFGQLKQFILLILCFLVVNGNIRTT